MAGTEPWECGQLACVNRSAISEIFRLCLQVCPKDYLPSLLKYVDAENIPRYLGGQSDATLIDDAGPWNDPQIRSEIEEDIAFRDGVANHNMPRLSESPKASSTSSQTAAPGAVQGSMASNADSAYGREAEAAPPAKGQQALGVPAQSQRQSPFAAQSQNPPFDAVDAQVNLRAFSFCVGQT